MARKLKQSRQFKKELAQLRESGDLPRLDESLSGICFCIENDAESHIKFVAPVKVGIIKTHGTESDPPIRVVFWIVNAGEAQLEAISLAEPIDQES